MTAEDVGTSDGDMTVIAEQTEHVAGLALERGGSGDPSPWTALGVETAIRVAAERIWGTDDLSGRSVAVVGLGHVGGGLARALAAGGARLIVADVAPAKRALAEELGADWAEPDEALRAEVDIVAPCALGGVIDHARSPRCAAAWSPARRTTSSRPRSSPASCAPRGILWAPDFVANAGGIINISVELEPEGYDPERARQRVLRSATPCARCSRRPRRTAPTRSSPPSSTPARGSSRKRAPGAPGNPGAPCIDV